MHFSALSDHPSATYLDVLVHDKNIRIDRTQSSVGDISLAILAWIPWRTGGVLQGLFASARDIRFDDNQFSDRQGKRLHRSGATELLISKYKILTDNN